MREHLSNKLKELGSKQTSATLLSSNVMQETCPDLLCSRSMHCSRMQSYPTSTECPAQGPTSKTGPDLQQSEAMQSNDESRTVKIHTASLVIIKHACTNLLT